MKKLMSVLLALALVMSLNVAAMAADLATTGDIGVAGTWTEKDHEILQGNTINIKKELLSYNVNSTSVNAPAFSYVYTVTPASVSDLTVTDETNDHASGTAVMAPVNAGKTAGLKVNGGESGSETSAVGTLAFTNATTLTTSSAGGSNLYNITLDFSGVSFTKPGVYRYKIEETLANNKTYAEIAIKDASNQNIRYLDVYVDGELKIYGYVCMAENASVTSNTQKTNGFVSASDGADKYYTYDLVLSKQVENDNYGEGHAFPFTVIFNNTPSYTTTFTITENAANGSTGISPTAASAPTWSGVAKVKEGATITYTGIPAGVDVDVYETNDMTGVTYTVVTTVNGTAGTPDNNVSWGNTPNSAAVQPNPKTAAYESTKATVDTKDINEEAPTTAKQTVEIKNTLLLISPTGVVLRIAPYVLILVGGIALLLISRRRKAASEEE